MFLACEKTDFFCESEERCLPNSWRCDGFEDCKYHEKEEDIKSCREEIPDLVCNSVVKTTVHAEIGQGLNPGLNSFN